MNSGTEYKSDDSLVASRVVSLLDWLKAPKPAPKQTIAWEQACEHFIRATNNLKCVTSSQCVKEHPDEPCPRQIITSLAFRSHFDAVFHVNLQILLVNNRWLVCK